MHWGRNSPGSTPCLVVEDGKKNIFVWRTGVSIPVPLECESSALPFELVPLVVLGKINATCIDRMVVVLGVSTEFAEVRIQVLIALLKMARQDGRAV